MRVRYHLWPLLLLGLCGLPSAWGAAALDRVALDIDPLPASEERARYRLQLSYRSVGELKLSGFKYLGKDEPQGMRVTTLSGEAMDSSVRLEPSSHEYRVDYRLPPPDPTGLQVVVLEFAQRLRLGQGFGSLRGQVSWAHKFKIPVQSMRVTVDLPPGAELPGYRCLDSQRGRTCIRTTPEAQEVLLQVPTGSPFSGFGVLGATGALCALGLWLMVRHQRHQLLRTRGVIPPATAVAYPDGADPYRAPPPLPQTPEPVLPKEERAAFLRRTGVLLGLLVLVVGASAMVLASGLLPWPPVLTLSALMICATAVCLLLLSMERPAVLLWYGPPVLAIVLFQSAVALVVASVAMLIVYAISNASSGRSAGGGVLSGASSSYSGGSSCSSSSGSSSCSSSSGSSCGGGGGGGGCGGGGGGGGCGG